MSQSSSTSVSGPVSIGGIDQNNSPAWLLPALIGGGVLLALLAWFTLRKK